LSQGAVWPARWCKWIAAGSDPGRLQMQEPRLGGGRRSRGMLACWGIIGDETSKPPYSEIRAAEILHFGAAIRRYDQVAATIQPAERLFRILF